MLKETFQDEEILGIDNDGCLIAWNATKSEKYNTGETLEQFGPENLTETEKARLNVRL